LLAAEIFQYHSGTGFVHVHVSVLWSKSVSQFLNLCLFLFYFQLISDHLSQFQSLVPHSRCLMHFQFTLE
jgi:hypothetical protein